MTPEPEVIEASGLFLTLEVGTLTLEGQAYSLSMALGNPLILFVEGGEPRRHLQINMTKTFRAIVERHLLSL